MIKDFISKEIDFNFNRKVIKIALSPFVFSSFQIDLGSQFLLKTILKQGICKDDFSVFDLGCGVGTIGLTLASNFRNIDLTVQDRNSIAVDITLHNAKQNLIKINSAKYGLAFSGIEDRYNLIVSNIPAKAGEPVIEDFVRLSLTHLKGDGICAVVIVRSLSEIFSKILWKFNCNIDYVEKLSDYSVFHFSPSLKTEIKGKKFNFLPYIRESLSFNVFDRKFDIDTVFNLPEFNQISFETDLATKLFFQEKFNSAVFVNPCQGILPIIFLELNKSCKNIDLISDDSLQLEITKKNINKFFPDVDVNIYYYDALFYLPKELEKKENVLFVAPVVSVFIFDYISVLKNAINKILSKKSFFILYGKTCDIEEKKIKSKDFFKIKGKKHKGYKAVLYSSKI